MPNVARSWSTADPDVVSIDGNGLATAVGFGRTDVDVVIEGFTSGGASAVVRPMETVAVGASHSCALTSSGEAYCWGANRWGQLGDGSTTPKELPGAVQGGHIFSQVSSGVNGDHSCAVSVDGAVYCWGRNEVGQVDGHPNPDPVSVPRRVEIGDSAIYVAAGGAHTCAVMAGGSAFCWGKNDLGQLGIGIVSETAPPTKVETTAGFASVHAGQDHTCALSGTKGYCWGSNWDGAVAISANNAQTTPIGVSVSLSFRSIALGDRITCGATTDGEVHCWGVLSGLGLGSAGHGVPVAVPGVANAAVVSAGRKYACALLRDGRAMCWGSDTEGKLGIGGTPTGEVMAPAEVEGGHRFSNLGLGSMTSCGRLLDGRVACWGSNSSGQLGTGGSPVHVSPAEVQGGHRFRSLAAGESTTCGVDQTAGLWCWGEDYDGDGPSQIAPQNEWAEVDVGSLQACAVTTGGEAYCWGRSSSGALGNGQRGSSLDPVRVQSNTKFVMIATGWDFTCAAPASGDAECWGTNQRGELGTGSASFGSSVPVSGLTGFAPTALRGGLNFGCGLDASGVAWCWGSSTTALGRNAPLGLWPPVQVEGGHVFKEISAGKLHACGVDTAGTGWCWGRGGEGQVGQGFRSGPAIPATVMSGTPLQRIAAGGEHTCAVTATGAVYCWGSNLYGQLGIGDASIALTPQPADFDLPLVRLASGRSHTCGLTEEGVAYCWGRNQYGQVGVPVTLRSSVPVLIPPF
jgi:alpha-tubulin suppressor-like RCC1 family protein